LGTGVDRRAASDHASYANGSVVLPSDNVILDSASHSRLAIGGGLFGEREAARQGMHIDADD
jgi:hypothetical protein